MPYERVKFDDHQKILSYLHRSLCILNHIGPLNEREARHIAAVRKNLKAAHAAQTDFIENHLPNILVP